MFKVTPFIGIMLILCIVSVLANADDMSREKAEWFDSGFEELKKALDMKINTNKAKNVVLFMGDGMGPNTVTATRIHEKGEEGLLEWERFPHMGLLKTYSANMQTPDSASTATALFGGVKTNSETSGVTSAVTLSDCAASLNKRNHVDSILQWAQDKGMATGFVTNTRVTTASPSALFAHTPNRRWECESNMPAAALAQGCKDIGRQLFEDEPGRSLNVIMGGGRQGLVSGLTGTPDDPLNEWGCVSRDGRQLLTDWHLNHTIQGRKAAVVETTGQLEAIDDDVDYLLGIFANGNIPYDHIRKLGPSGMPSLEHMTEKAIKVLSRNPNGFILVVESGMIDQAHHRGWARVAVNETAALDDAVKATVELLRPKASESLLIVTADHTHTLSINGYARRGSSIFGIALPVRPNHIPYTTLTYATGGADGWQMERNANGEVNRRNPTQDDTESFDYVQQVAIESFENTHGGPMSHLFHSVHEQSYVAHVVAYAARIGRFRDPEIVPYSNDPNMK